MTIWGALAAWMLLVAVGAVPPPPFSTSSWITAPIMFAVMLGGLLFGAGMILRRYVVTPGMVRQFAAGKDVRSYEGGAVPAGATSAAATSPWRILGWMLITGLIVVPGCLAVMLGVLAVNVCVADMNADFKAAGNVASLFADDVHPNDAGFHILAQGWFKAITRGRAAAASAAMPRFGFEIH